MNVSDILLSVDFDRTLTDRDSAIPPRNLEAIRYFIDNGGSFTVNTGRSLPMSRCFLEQVPINAPLLLCNGSAAYDLEREQLVFCHELPLEPRKVLKSLAAQYPDLVVEMEGLYAHYTYSTDPLWEAFCDYNGCAHRPLTDDAELGPFMKLTVYGPLHGVAMSDLYTGTPEELARYVRLTEELQAQFGHIAEVCHVSPRNIDIQLLGITKHTAARRLQKQLGKKLLVCVGDGENDLAMLTGADYAFCPSDGPLADRFPNVCPCDEGSVAHVIYEKIPEILANNP